MCDSIGTSAPPPVAVLVAVLTQGLSSCRTCLVPRLGQASPRLWRVSMPSRTPSLRASRGSGDGRITAEWLDSDDLRTNAGVAVSGVSRVVVSMPVTHPLRQLIDKRPESRGKAQRHPSQRLHGPGGVSSACAADAWAPTRNRLKYPPSPWKRATGGGTGLRRAVRTGRTLMGAPAVVLATTDSERAY